MSVSCHGSRWGRKSGSNLSITSPAASLYPPGRTSWATALPCCCVPFLNLALPEGSGHILCLSDVQTSSQAVFHIRKFGHSSYVFKCIKYFFLKKHISEKNKQTNNLPNPMVFSFGQTCLRVTDCVLECWCLSVGDDEMALLQFCKHFRVCISLYYAFRYLYCVQRSVPLKGVLMDVILHPAQTQLYWG